MKHILLLGATFSTGNLGVGALTSGALTVLSHRYPDAKVSLLDYGHNPTATRTLVRGHMVDVPLINLRFSWKVLLPNNVALLLVFALLARVVGPRLRAWLVDQNPWLKAIADADMAAAVSGGDSFSDIYGQARFFYVTLPKVLVILLGVKLVLLPQTMGPFRHPLSGAVARSIVQRANLIYTRDRAGLCTLHQLMRGQVLRSLPRFCPDMAFVMEPHASQRLSEFCAAVSGRGARRPLVGLNVSGLLWMGGYTQSNMFKLKLNYRELIERLIAHLVNECHANVVLIPHVHGQTDESDTVAIHQVQSRLLGRFDGRLSAMLLDLNQNEVKHAIGQCDFFVGSRMHACIAALSQGVPAVGVAYSDKFHGVFASVDAENMVVDPRKLDINDALRAIHGHFVNRMAAAQRLRTKMPSVRADVLAMLDAVT
jgi:colanic acid/amylovoran biosynthesis protein